MKRNSQFIQRYPNDVADWLAKAVDDLKWAKDNFRLGYFTQVCFITQQIVEKALKVYLLAQNVTVKKIHTLPLLLKQCRKFSPKFDQFIRPCALLDRYYTDARYPKFGPGGEYSKEEAEEALKLAKEILEFIQNQIKS